MTSYSRVHCQEKPKSIEITNSRVFINKNIVPYTNDNFSGYEFDVDIYDKDEYIVLLAESQEDLAALREELEAAKILLGVK